MGDRGLGALCFASGAAAMSLLGLLVFEEVALLAALVAVPAALGVGALTGPWLAADARRARQTWRGAVAGALVTVVSAVLAAFALSLWIGATSGESLSDALGWAGVVFLFGSIFLVPAIPLGMIAGWVVYARTLAGLEADEALLEGPSLEGPSLEGPSLEGPAGDESARSEAVPAEAATGRS